MKEMNDVQELMNFIKQVTNEELTKRKKGDSPLHVKIELHEANDGTQSVELKINDGGADPAIPERT